LSSKHVRFVTLALAIFVLPVGTVAQAPSRVPTVGILSAAPSVPATAAYREAFERGLKELGWIPG
jgi:hypothetical protein